MSVLDDPNILADQIESKMVVGGYVSIGVSPPETLYKDLFQKYWKVPIEFIIDIIRKTPIDDQWRVCIKKLDNSSKKYLRDFNANILENIIEQTGLKSEFTYSPEPLSGYWVLSNDKSVCKVIATYCEWNFYFTEPKKSNISIQLRKPNTHAVINSLL